MTSSSDEPAASRIARTFSNVRFVSDRTSPSSSFPVCGLVHPCPARKMKSPSTTACEYGPIGLGALSVTMAFLTGSSSIVSKVDKPEILRQQSADRRSAKSCLPESVPKGWPTDQRPCPPRTTAAPTDSPVFGTASGPSPSSVSERTPLRQQKSTPPTRRPRSRSSAYQNP